VSVFAAVATGTTQSLDLQDLVNGSESQVGGLLVDDSVDVCIVKFRDRTAGAADQKLAAVWIIGVGASDERVQRIQPVHEVRFDQKFQCPVNGWRGCFVAVIIELIENFVRANRLVAVPYEFQDPAPLHRKAQAPAAADALRGVDRPGYAAFMIVFLARETICGARLAHYKILVFCIVAAIVPCIGGLVSSVAAWHVVRFLYNSARSTRTNPAGKNANNSIT
jgi:hypothetical protein